MADSGELSPSPEAVAKFFPYGRAGYSVGRYALYALHAPLRPKRMPSPSAHRQRYWTQGDHQSFDSALGLELASRRLRMSLDVPDEQRQGIADHLQELLATFREALPYSEAERRWLVDTRERLREEHKVPYTTSYGVTGLVSAPDANQLRYLKATEGEIVSGGIHQNVQGHDLARRWWSWRRQTDEFTDQGSRDLASHVLRGLGQMLVPDRGQFELAGLQRDFSPERL